MSALFRDVIVAVLEQESAVLQRWLDAGAVSHVPFPTRASAGVQEIAARIVEELHEIGGITISGTHDRVLAERALHAALGHDAAHDDALTHAELTQAAICYAETAHAQVCQPTPAPPGFKHRDWPFDMRDFHADPDVTQNLVKAAAYLIAEAERLTRRRVRQMRGTGTGTGNAKTGAEGKPQVKTAVKEEAQPQGHAPSPSTAPAQDAAQAKTAAAPPPNSRPPGQTPITPYVKIEPGSAELAPLIHIYLPHPDDLRPAG